MIPIVFLQKESTEAKHKAQGTTNQLPGILCLVACALQLVPCYLPIKSGLTS
jgi:hypothetical protein